MSGHSKWAQIKHQKATTDKKRGQIFSKIIRQLTIAAREGGSDPASNFKLRLVMEKARDAEMPKENIERAIQKAAGGEGGVQIEQAVYEGFGLFGTSFIIEVATDSKNRAASSIRHIFEQFGGTMGQPGSVSWAFETKGQILVKIESKDQSEMELAAIEAGAEDVRISPEGLEIYTTPLDLKNVKQELEKKSFQIVSAEIVMEAKSKVNLTEEQKTKVQSLYDALMDNENVVAVHTSANL